MTKTHKTTTKATGVFTLSPAVLQDVERRKPDMNNNASAVVDRDLTRIYSVYDHYRARINSLFTDKELQDLRGIFNPHRISMRTMRATGVLALVQDLVHQEIIPKRQATKIMELQVVEVLTLLDTVGA